MTLEGLIKKRKDLIENLRDASIVYAGSLRKLADKVDKEGDCVLDNEFKMLEQAMLNDRKAYMEAWEELNAINSKDFEF